MYYHNVTLFLVVQTSNFGETYRGPLLLKVLGSLVASHHVASQQMMLDECIVITRDTFLGVSTIYVA